MPFTLTVFCVFDECGLKKGVLSKILPFLSFPPHLQQDDFHPVLLCCKTSCGKIIWATDWHGSTAKLFPSEIVERGVSAFFNVML